MTTFPQRDIIVYIYILMNYPKVEKGGSREKKEHLIKIGVRRKIVETFLLIKMTTTIHIYKRKVSDSLSHKSKSEFRVIKFDGVVFFKRTSVFFLEQKK